MTFVECLPLVFIYVLGTALVCAEVFLPGFGLPGISGVLLLCIGTWQAAKIFSGMTAVIILLLVVIILVAVIFFALRSASKGKLKESKIFLNAEDAALPNKTALSEYLGREGVALTALRPAGKGEFEGELIDVVSNGEFLEKDSRIKVIALDGNRVVVEKI